MSLHFFRAKYTREEAEKTSKQELIAIQRTAAKFGFDEEEIDKAIDDLNQDIRCRSVLVLTCLEDDEDKVYCTLVRGKMVRFSVVKYYHAYDGHGTIEECSYTIYVFDSDYDTNMCTSEDWDDDVRLDLEKEGLV